MTQAELLAREELRPSDLKRFGKRVRYFSVDALLEKRGESITLRRAKEVVFKEIEDYLKANKGAILYTGIHKENDWSRTFYWLRGGHLVNRTLEFAVILAA